VKEMSTCEKGEEFPEKIESRTMWEFVEDSKKETIKGQGTQRSKVREDCQHATRKMDEHGPMHDISQWASK
jgi:hypothetical protein